MFVNGTDAARRDDAEAACTARGAAVALLGGDRRGMRLMAKPLKVEPERYLVSYDGHSFSNPGGFFMVDQADDVEHAKEQCRDANPDCTILNVYQLVKVGEGIEGGCV